MFSLSPFLTLTLITISAALDLGHGGVYDSPEAQEYWQERFGDLGAARLVQAQEKIFEESIPTAAEKETADLTLTKYEEESVITSLLSSSPASLSISSAASLIEISSPSSPFSLTYISRAVKPSFLYQLLSNQIF